MASRREIAITIKGNVSTSGGNGEISFSREPVSSDDNARSEAGKYSNDARGKKGGWGPLALYAANSIKRQIENTASMAWNRYVDMKEDYLAQNNMNAVKANIGMVKSYATSIATGAKIGAAAGPVGAAVGAVVGAVGNVVNRGLNYKITMANYNEQNNSMNAQTNFSRVRMGLIDGGRGTEN